MEQNTDVPVVQETYTVLQVFNEFPYHLIDKIPLYYATAIVDGSQLPQVPEPQMMSLSPHESKENEPPINKTQINSPSDQLNKKRKRKDDTEPEDITAKRPALQDITEVPVARFYEHLKSIESLIPELDNTERERYLNCIACEMGFMSSRTLKKHFNTKMHINNVAKKNMVDPKFQEQTWVKPIYKCVGNKCNFNYKRLNDMKRHLESHHCKE